MKFLAKSILIVLTIPFFVLCALSINIRFQFLLDKFWISTFKNSNVYLQISKEMEGKLISKVVATGSKKEDVGLLSGIVSSENIESFFESNIKSFLSYANGSSSEIMVYVPLSVKDNSSYDSLGNFREKMSLTDFLQALNISNIKESDMRVVSKFGIWSWILTTSSFILFFIVLFLEYLLTDSGKRFTSLGISLLFSGFTLLAISFLISFAGFRLSQNFQNSTNFTTSLAAIVTYPLIGNITRIWNWFGVSATVLGAILFFVKKPVNNKLK